MGWGTQCIVNPIKLLKIFILILFLYYYTDYLYRFMGHNYANIRCKFRGYVEGTYLQNATSVATYSKSGNIFLCVIYFHKVFRGHTDKLVHVAQISDGRVCSCSLDANIRIWNIRSGACEQVLSGHTLNSRWTVQVMNGQLVSCSRDKTIRFWDLKTGKTVKTLTGHSDYVRCLLLLADDRIVSGSDDHTMRVWG